MKRTIWNDSYRLLNLIFAGIILALFVYSIYYGGDRTHPVPSFYNLLTGENSISTGLTRSFSAIVRLNFNDAREYNPHGIRIFLFFLIQLLLRTTGIVLANHAKRSMIILIDITVSAILFMVLFWPFIMNLFEEL